MILRAYPGFLERIKRTFIVEDKVLMIGKNEKTLGWAKYVIEAIAPSLVIHKGYDAKGPKNLSLEKTFGIWLPTNFVNFVKFLQTKKCDYQLLAVSSP